MQVSKPGAQTLSPRSWSLELYPCFGPVTNIFFPRSQIFQKLDSLCKSAFNFPKAHNWQELAFCAKILRQNLEFASRAKIQNLRANLQPLSSQRVVCELGQKVELITFEILAAERLRLMGFNNRLIIDGFANVVNILIWSFSTNVTFRSEKYESNYL